jgi:hypothetical protein
VAEVIQQLLRVDPQLLEQARVVLVIDLVGELRIGLLSLIALTPALQQADDLFLGYLRSGPFSFQAG